MSEHIAIWQGGCKSPGGILEHSQRNPADWELWPDPPAPKHRAAP